MKQISIQALKAKLSEAISEAAEGRSIVITRHNRPVAQLVPARQQHVHDGTRMGQGSIKPAMRRGTKGRYLSVLLEDRNDR